MIEKDAERPTWLLDRIDCGWILVLMGLGLALRLAYWSGYGLADDPIFRGNVVELLKTHGLLGDNISYRLAWLIPTTLFCKIFGLTEFGMIFPVTATGTLGIGLVYALGKSLYGRSGALIAALLLIAQPLDFAWSTMWSNDIFVSFFSALSIFFLLRALRQEVDVWKSRLWILTGMSLWLGCQARVSAAAVLPAVAVICWMHRRRLDTTFVDFVVTVGVLSGGTSIMYYLVTNDPIGPYHAEFFGYRMSAADFWTYPNVFFWRDHLGHFLHAWYPHLLVVLALASPWLRIRTSREVFWWLLFVFAALQFNVKWVDGAWFTAFRNIRHAHVLVYPTILLLAGYLVGLRRQHRMWCDGVVAALLVFGLWQGIAVASKTKVAFADRREACRFLATLPPKPIYADVPLQMSCLVLEGVPWKFEAVQSEPGQGKLQLAAGTSGYLVTGGSREPIYGPLFAGAPRADALTPGKWKLLREVPGPAQPSPWRPEPLRVWEAVESAP